MLTIFGWNFECWAVQKRVDLVDIVKSFQTSILNILFETDSYPNEYLLAKFGVDTAENEPLKVCQKLAESYNNS